MSNIYIQEPPTDGKVLLTTTVGDIDIELWSREAPKACRNFIQLCMEGYYNGTIFHRIIKDFIAQGGDPTGTGDGGESIYGKTFRDEIHTRLRFVRRGLVAMANAGKDDNASQFFFTLGPTQELQGKHTVFGKVTGETIYNLIKLNDIHTDDNDRPLDPPKIKKTEILSNPFDDIEPRETIKSEKIEKKKKSKSQSKATKDFKLLSFGEEAEEDEEIANKVSEEFKSKGGKSAHDLADDPRLSHVAGDLDMPPPEASGSKSSEENLLSVKQKLDKYNQEKAEKGATADKKEASSSKIEEMRREQKKLMKEMSSKNKDKSAADEKSAEEEKRKSKDSEAVSEFKKEQQLYKQQKKSLPKKGSSSREAQTLAILAKFESKLRTVQRLNSDYNDEDEAEPSADSADKDAADKDADAGQLDDEETDEGWMSHKLEFGDSHKKVLDANVTDVDRYEIHDPRNPMTKRRNEEAAKDAKRRRKEKDSKV